MGLVTAAAVGAAGAIGSAALSRKGGSSGSTVSQMPPWMQAQYQTAQRYDSAAAARTADQAIAGFTPDQLAAFKQVRATQGFLQPDMADAQARAKTLAGGITADDIARFQNPYTNDVVNTALADINRQRDIARTGIADRAEAASAWGGDRAEVARNLSDDSYIRTAASTDANLRDQGFNTALDAAFRNNSAGITGNDQLMRIIEARSQANSGDTASLLATGTQQQSQDQRMRDWMIQQGQIAGAHLSTDAGGSRNYTTPGADLAGQVSGWTNAAGSLQKLWDSIYNRPPNGATPG